MKTLVILAVFSVFIVVTTSTALRNTVCRDRYIWWADGSIDCEYLQKESLWGVHKNPEYWCNTYSLTDCCQTCTRMRAEGLIS